MHGVQLRLKDDFISRTIQVIGLEIKVLLLWGNFELLYFYSHYFAFI
jgi:hypothetical protein